MQKNSLRMVYIFYEVCLLMIEPDNVIEADIDNLLLSPTSTPKESIPENTTEESPSRAGSQSPAIPPNVVNYFPYVLGVQCWLGGRIDRPLPSEADIVTAQINTSVHASFIDNALIHNLGISHRIRNRRPPRYNTTSHRFQAAPRPRILLPVYFPMDATQQPSSITESQVAKIQIDFVVVSTHDLSPLEHQKLISLEIGSQALFLHGIDVLFSSRCMRISGLNIPLPHVAPRDQKRLLSSIALAPFTPTSQQQQQQPSWDRLRRNPGGNKSDEIIEQPSTNDNTWNEDPLLRDTSTNSSFSSTSATFQSTALTSPALTETDPTIKGGGLPTPPLTAGVFSSALRFIPSSVVAKPIALKEESRSKGATIDELMEKNAIALDRSRSYQSEQSNSKDDDKIHRSSNTISEDNIIEHIISETILPRLPIPSPTLEVQSIPSRKSSFTEQIPLTEQQQQQPLTPSRKSSLKDLDEDDLSPRLPSHLIDKPLIMNVQRKTSSTWPRSLGKKVAPWTSHDATKTSILGTAFDSDNSAIVVPPRKMKVLKPVTRRTEIDSPEGLKVDLVKDVVRVEVKDCGAGEEHGKGLLASKNVGGGAFHWMK